MLEPWLTPMLRSLALSLCCSMPRSARGPEARPSEGAQGVFDAFRFSSCWRLQTA